MQYFFNRRLKVVFEPPLPVMEDDEPFVLNGLESFQLKDALLQVLLDHPEGADEAVRLFVSEQKPKVDYLLALSEISNLKLIVFKRKT